MNPQTTQAPSDVPAAEMEVISASEKLPLKLREPWRQQRGEEDRHYAVFLHYRDLTEDRSVAAALASWNNVPRKIAPSGSWGVIAKKWNWVARADAWDKHVAEHLSQVRLSKREKAQSKLDDALLNIVESIADIGSASDLATVKLQLQKFGVLVGREKGVEALREVNKILNPQQQDSEKGAQVVVLTFSN